MKAPVIIARAGWRAAAYRGEPQPLGTVRRIVVHHTAGARPESPLEARDAVRAVQRLHQRERNFDDTGYHLLIGAGLTFEGRERFDVDTFALGGHVRGHNTGSIGICVLGNYEIERPGYADLIALTRLSAWLCETYGLGPEDVVGDRDLKPTLCPGRYLYDRLDRVRLGVRVQQRWAGVLPWRG